MASDLPPDPPPDPPPAPTDHEPNALDYLRQHARTYTREAIDGRLREAGYEPAAIAAAWDELEADEGRRDADPRYLATFIAILGGLLAVLVFGGSAALGFLGAAMSQSTRPTTTTVLVLYGMAAIAAGIATLFLLRRGRRADHAVLGVFGAIGVAALTWLAISGLCLATWEGLEL